MPKIKCRRCEKEFVYNSISDIPTFPFCSKTCKLIDLGSWLNEEHSIEGPITNEVIEEHGSNK